MDAFSTREGALSFIEESLQLSEKPATNSWMDRVFRRKNKSDRRPKLRSAENKSQTLRGGHLSFPSVNSQYEGDVDWMNFKTAVNHIVSKGLGEAATDREKSNAQSLIESMKILRGDERHRDFDETFIRCNAANSTKLQLSKNDPGYMGLSLNPHREDEFVSALEIAALNQSSFRAYSRENTGKGQYQHTVVQFQGKGVHVSSAPERMPLNSKQKNYKDDKQRNELYKLIQDDLFQKKHLLTDKEILFVSKEHGGGIVVEKEGDNVQFRYAISSNIARIANGVLDSFPLRYYEIKAIETQNHEVMPERQMRLNQSSGATSRYDAALPKSTPLKRDGSGRSSGSP